MCIQRLSATGAVSIDVGVSPDEGVIRGESDDIWCLSISDTLFVLPFPITLCLFDGRCKDDIKGDSVRLLEG